MTPPAAPSRPAVPTRPHRDDHNPSLPQWAASDPFRSVWVSASAGTGKTKVLTDRVLRLLLPRPDGTPGTRPHRILCLTYTRAAAGEMTLRINKVLGDWAILPPEELYTSLEKTIGGAPTEDMLKAARQLFAQVVDTPGGLKIMTIHAFCQSVLGRFPLEAGILPHMSVLDDATASGLLKNAMMAHALENVQAETPYARLCAELSESDLQELLQKALQDFPQIQNFFDIYPQHEAQISALRTAYAAPQEGDVQDVLHSFCRIIDTPDLHRFAQALACGAKTDQARGVDLCAWLASDLLQRVRMYDSFKALFLTQKGELRSAPTKGTQAALEDAYDVQQAVGHKILTTEDRLKALRLVGLTHDLLSFTKDVQARYQQEKDRHGGLDYNDLILKTLSLLKRAGKGAAWVLYKLDDGLDHILLDEAQDTNPAQWNIISLLVEEFFSGQGQREDVRTLFVVGDEKQSIYRFQGAALEMFQYMRGMLGDKAIDAGVAWRNESLYVSFRSTRSVLEFVDAAFSTDPMRKDIGVPIEEDLTHISFREGHAGRVELWPLIEPEDPAIRTPWDSPVRIRTYQSEKARLAERIAKQIDLWLKEKRLLPSKGRPVRPGDIMILVRRRSVLVDLLVRALKSRNIPISGADRLILNHHIAVKDLLSLASFALQPRDNLALAEVLRSPFIDLDPQTLEDWCYERSGDLWPHILAHAPDALKNWLMHLPEQAARSPFAFFYEILNTPCPAHPSSGLAALRARLGEDCLDVLDEFLQMVQGYEQEYLPQLQSFLLWQDTNPVEIKKEQSGTENAVRIMTAHGAKGLQAPIVILPDTTRNKNGVQKKIPRLLLPQRTESSVPLWSPRKALECDAYTQALEKIAAQETAEYKRLFYVAATRAEDELIICDIRPKRAEDTDSWYHYAAEAFTALGDAVYEESAGFDPNVNVRVYAHAQSTPPDLAAPQEQTDESESAPVPAWAYLSPPEEPHPPRPLRPSRPSEDEPASVSPKQMGADIRFRRGTLTHTLLQFLPDLPDAQRERTGAAFLAVNAADFSEDVRHDILVETLRVMRTSSFADIFSPQAQAEVPVSGHLPSGQLLSGQIDRLLIGAQEILIIDYKTNRPPPQDSRDIPKAYRAQMQAYRDALAQIYPHHKIRCALLWTYGPHLMEIL
ncbi:MAG: double-strand break repair helicase AddA [Rhodospirillales bacterium]|nr:double-strand break repair helicase AddA [Rhodospirillales bacterium]